MKIDRNHFAAKHADAHFDNLVANPKAKVRMPTAEARCLLLRHTRVCLGFIIFETYAKSVGAGVYEVGLREVKP